MISILEKKELEIEIDDEPIHIKWRNENSTLCGLDFTGAVEDDYETAVSYDDICLNCKGYVPEQYLKAVLDE